MLALGQDSALAALPDEAVLPFAATEERVVVTHNIRHFAPLFREWAEGGRTHAGCILALRHNAYGDILRGLEELFRDRPAQADWINRARFLA